MFTAQWRCCESEIMSGKLFVLIVGIALCGRGLWLLLGPAQYQAVVRLEISPDIDIDSNGNTYAPYQPYFMETELRTMSGDVVLSNVAETLNLNAEWSQRYAKGGQLQTGQTVELLRRHMTAGPEQGTKFVDIFVWDEDPNQAARIANAVAGAYRDYRIQQHRQEVAVAIEALGTHYQQEETEIAVLQGRLERMRKQLVPTNPAPTDAMVMEIYNAKQASLDPLKGQLSEPQAVIKASKTDIVRVASLDRLKQQVAATNSNPTDSKQMAHYAAYFQAKEELNNKEESHGLLKSRIQSIKGEEDKMNREGALDKLARIVVPAAVPKSPAAPKRWHGVVWLICGLGLLQAGVKSILSSRKPVKLKS